MKKIVVVSFLLFFTITIFAQVSIGVMGRVGFSSSILTINGLNNDAINDLKKIKLDYGGGGYVSWTFLGGLGVQAEVAYILNKGLYLKDNTGEISFTVSAVEIPVMLNYTFFRTNSLRMKLVLGPRFSFTMGDMRSVILSDSRNIKPSNDILIGITGGVDFIYGFNQSTAFLAGVRYGRDFTKVLDNGGTVLTLAELYINIGFEYRFGKVK